MKNGIRFIAALSMAIAGMMSTTVMVNHVAATTAIDCGCGNRACDGGCRLGHRRSTCTTCDTQCGCVECPQCEDDICRLELDNSPVKRTGFKVEQKAVCIPSVRMPWMKCCPPGTSKTRTVNRLKKHTYECPNCSYKWTVQKPEFPCVTSVGSAPAEVVQMDSQIPPAPVYREANAIQPWHPAPPTVEDPVAPYRR